MIKLFMDKDHHNFSRLWLAQLISQFGDRIHQLALVGLIAQRAPGSAMGLAKLMAFTILPVFVVQPFAGVLVDRWDRRTMLFVCDLLRCFLVLSIPFWFMDYESMIPVYIIVFLVFCFSRFYIPAKMSIIPDLVESRHLLMANSLVSTTGMIAFALGCAAGGFLIDRFGARNGFLIDAGTFLLSGMILFSMDVRRHLKQDKDKMIKHGKEIAGPIHQSIMKELKEGVRYLIERKEIRFVMNMLFVMLSAAGAVYVVIIVFIQQVFQSVTKDLGIVAVCLGAGLFAGALLYGKWGKRFVWYKTIFFCLICGGFMLILFAILVSRFPHLWVAMGLAFLWGVVAGPIFISSNTVVHLVSDESMRGKVFSALEIVIHFAFLTAMLISSWLSELIGSFWILIGVGVSVTVVGLIGLSQKMSSIKNIS